VGNFSVVVLDFETSGLSPNHGERAIEIGAVLLTNNKIVDRFQSLMNPEMKISCKIEKHTGITNQMLSDAPSIAEVMNKFKNFMSQHHLVAHNASFDKRFLDAELLRINLQRHQDFVCTMSIARRIYPDSPKHTLETLVSYKNLKTDGVHHRALSDAEMTAHLWISMIDDLKSSYKLKQIPFDLMHRLSKVPKSSVHNFLQRSADMQE
jgi:DNA polymerase-3 subunit epsilon